jgi:hypothetical protein
VTLLCFGFAAEKMYCRPTNCSPTKPRTGTRCKLQHLPSGGMKGCITELRQRDVLLLLLVFALSRGMAAIKCHLYRQQHTSGQAARWSDLGDFGTALSFRDRRAVPAHHGRGHRWSLWPSLCQLYLPELSRSCLLGIPQIGVCDVFDRGDQPVRRSRACDLAACTCCAISHLCNVAPLLLLNGKEVSSDFL